MTGTMAVLADDSAEDGDIDIPSWPELDALPGDLDALVSQACQIFDHARTWVCQRAGFVPHPVCLLSPLADLMDVIAAGFTEVQERVVDDLRSLRDAVVETTTELKTIDELVADWMPWVD